MSQKNEPINKPTYFHHIDGLRAIAVLVVVFYHYKLSGFSGGFIGVDVFFVISGYLISGGILREVKSNNSFSFKSFYFRRLKRLYPAFFFVSIISFLCSLVILPPSYFEKMVSSLVSALLAISNFFFLEQSGYFDITKAYKPFLHTWSLSVEEQFYLFIPLFLVAVSKSSKKILWLSLVFLASLTLSIRPRILQFLLTEEIIQKPSFSFFMMPFRIHEFLLGTFIHFIPQRLLPYLKSKKGIPEALFLIGLVLVIYPSIFFSSKIRFPYYNALFPCLGTAILIYIGNHSKFKILLENKISIFFGNISYSLYLTHWPIYSFAIFTLLRPLTFIESILLITLSILSAWIVLIFIENPMRYSKKLYKKPATTVFTIGFLTLILSTCIFLKFSSNSSFLNARFSPKSLERYKGAVWGGKVCKDIKCFVGNENDPNPIVVLGDSYAHHLAKGLSKHFPERGFYLYHLLCRVHSLEWYVYDNTYDEESCKGERQQKLIKEFDEMLVKKKPKIIFSIRLRPKKYYRYLENGNIEYKVFTEYNEKFAKFTFNEIDNFIKHFDISHTLLLSNTPELKGTIGSLELCHLRPLIFGKPPKPCRNASNTKNAQVNFINTYARHSKIDIVDLFKPFCEDGTCKYYDENNFYTSDGYHLSEYGSEIVFKYYKDKFLQFFQK